MKPDGTWELQDSERQITGAFPELLRLQEHAQVQRADVSLGATKRGPLAATDLPFEIAERYHLICAQHALQQGGELWVHSEGESLNISRLSEHPTETNLERKLKELLKPSARSEKKRTKAKGEGAALASAPALTIKTITESADKDDDLSALLGQPSVLTRRTEGQDARESLSLKQLRATLNAAHLSHKLAYLRERIILGGADASEAEQKRQDLKARIEAADVHPSITEYHLATPPRGHWEASPEHWPPDHRMTRFPLASWSALGLAEAINCVHPQDPHHAHWEKLQKAQSFEQAELSPLAPWVSDELLSSFVAWATSQLVPGAAILPGDISVKNRQLRIIRASARTRRAIGLIQRRMTVPIASPEDSALAQEIDDLFASYLQLRPESKALWQEAVTASPEEMALPEQGAKYAPSAPWPGWQGPAPHPWQRELAWSLAYLGEGIGAHEPGLGKTAAGTLLGLWSLAHGQGKTVLFVAPKSAINAWRRELGHTALRYAVIGEDERTSLNHLEEDIENARRQEIQLLLLSMSAFERLSVTEEEECAAREIAGDLPFELSPTCGTGPRLSKLNVSALIVDEAHNYKAVLTPQTLRARHLGGGAEAARSADMLTKSWVLRSQGALVAGLSATPWKNAPHDIYALSAIFAPSLLRALGAPTPEQFALHYVEFQIGERGLEATGMHHLRELRPWIRTYMHRRTAADVGMQLPEYRPKLHLNAPDQTTKNLLAEIGRDPQEVARFLPARVKANAGAKTSNGDGETESSANIPKSERALRKELFMLVRRAEMDAEMLEPIKHQGHVSAKVSSMLSSVARTVAAGGNALVFCEMVEMHTPLGINPHGYNFHDKLQRLIMERCKLSEGEVGVVNGLSTPSAASRREIEEGLANGRIRVLIGNLVMGESMNIQRGVSLIASLDVPHNGAGMEQRRGRAVRYGNTEKLVHGEFHLGNGGMDGRMLDTLRAKSRSAADFWEGKDRAAHPEEEVLPTLAAFRALAIEDDEKREQALKEAAQEEQNRLALNARRNLARLWHRYQLLLHGQSPDPMSASLLHSAVLRHPECTDEMRRYPHPGPPATFMASSGDLISVGTLLIDAEGMAEVTELLTTSKRMRLKRSWTENVMPIKTLERMQVATPEVQLSTLANAGHPISPQLAQDVGDLARGLYLAALFTSGDPWRPVLIRRKGELKEVPCSALLQSDAVLFGPDDTPENLAPQFWQSAMRQALEIQKEKQELSRKERRHLRGQSLRRAKVISNGT